MEYISIKEMINSNYADIKTGPFGTQLKASEYVDKGTPVLNVKNLGYGQTINDKLDHVNENTTNRLFMHLLKTGDIVFGRKGAVDRHAYITDDEKGWMQGSDCIRLRILCESFNPRFLSYYFMTKKHRQFMEMMCSHGTTMSSLNQKILEQITIPYLDRKVQDTIVSILQGIDDRIANNKKINQNFLQQMESLYKAWFIDYVPFEGKRPSDWIKSDIYTIADIIYGAPFASKLFNTDGEGIPIIRIRDLKEQSFVTYTTEKHPKGHLIQPGDIVVGMDGEFRPYIWGNTTAWLNQRVCIFDNKRPKGKAFVLFTIKPLLYRIEQTQVATTVIHIGKKDFDAFEFFLPDENTLERFDEITSPMIERIVGNRLENKRLSELRDCLLPKLMSGELDVSEIEL